MINLKEELITNVDFYKELLNKELLKRANLLKSEDRLFHNDIENEFIFVIRSKLAEDLTKRFAINPEECIIELEELNLKDILC